MTSSSVSPTAPAPTAPPPAPVLRIRDPGELVAALPFLIGFRPCDSLLLVAFGGETGRRIELTQRIDLPPPEHAPAVCRALAGNLLLSEPSGAAVLVVGGEAAGRGALAYGAAPPHGDLVAAATDEVEARGVPVRIRAWAAGTEAGAAWACYDECRCRGALPDPASTPLAASAVAAGLMVYGDRGALERLVAPAPVAVLRRRGHLLTRAVEAALAAADAGSEADVSGRAVVDLALADTVAGRLHLDDGRVVALALALSDPAVRDAALVRCARPGFEGADQLWAALARETPDPEAAEPAALLAACALLRGDGALAGIALDRAEQAWPEHRLTALLRAAWVSGMRPDQVRECLVTAPTPTPTPGRKPGAGRAAGRRRGR